MKGDVWFLRSDSGYVESVFIVDLDDLMLSGRCYEPYTWGSNGFPWEMHYLTGVYMKPDACTHWYFRGEDYVSGNDDEIDAYYHLCSCFGFNTHIRSMCFVWKLAADLITESLKNTLYTRDVHSDYFENETTRKLVNLMLYGYRIEKASEKDVEYIRGLV